MVWNRSGCLDFTAGQGARSTEPETYMSYVEDSSTATPPDPLFIRAAESGKDKSKAGHAKGVTSHSAKER